MDKATIGLHAAAGKRLEVICDQARSSIGKGRDAENTTRTRIRDNAFLNPLPGPGSSREVERLARLQLAQIVSRASKVVEENWLLYLSNRQLHQDAKMI